MKHKTIYHLLHLQGVGKAGVKGRGKTQNRRGGDVEAWAGVARCNEVKNVREERV